MYYENVLKLSIITSIIFMINAIIFQLTYQKCKKRSDLYSTCIQNIQQNKTNTYNSILDTRKIRVGLLTNEIPPIVYGGVATWIVNFINMFKTNNKMEVIPIFLAFQDDLPEECLEKYPNIRIIKTPDDIQEAFKDIDICINNLWIALDTIITIKELFPTINIISVCHSLIRMEHITNLGSQYTNNFNEQETTFQQSDYVVLISHAEKDYYDQFGYNMFKTRTAVIYNSYIPKCDHCESTIDYSSNHIGYIGRHVPRKRPEIPIKAVDYLQNETIKVYNMGVDYDKYDNAYWRKLAKEYVDQLVVIPFSTDKKVKENYWSKIGINCITGIYEPFGYTICESIDRGVPVIVQNIDGPKEIVEEIKEHVYMYDVDTKDYKQDILNFSKTLEHIWNTPPEIRRVNAIKARKCLDKLRPEVISKDWEHLIQTILSE